MRRAAAVVIALAAWLVAAPVAWAQTSTPADLSAWLGRTVTAVHITVEGRHDDRANYDVMLELLQGQPLTVAAVRSSLAQLLSSGRFDDVVVRALPSTTSPSGVEVSFDVVPRHPVDRLAFTGTTGLPPATLERELRQQFGGLPRDAQADAAARAVLRVLNDAGFRSATAHGSLDVTHAPDRATLVLAVDAGPRALVRSARVEGASPLAPAEILRRAGAIVGEPYRPRLVDAGLDVVLDELRQRGYYEATVGHTHDAVSADGRSVDVVVTVDVGPLVTLVLAGDPVSGNVNDLVPIKREGSVDDDLLEDSVRRIEAALRKDGYWRARATYARAETPGGRTITITVTRGARFRLERIDVTGHTRLSTAQVAALFPIEPGAPFDESKIGAGIAALREAYRLDGYAAATVAVTTTEVPPARAGGEPRVVVGVAVTEGVGARVAEVVVTGATRLTAAEITGVMRLKRDAPFVPGFITADREAIHDQYDLKGYASAVVDVRVRLSDDGTRATVTVDVVNEGPQTVVDQIIITGNRRVSEATIRTAVALTRGEPLGEAARAALQQRLAALGSFRRVNITEAPNPSGQPGTDIVIAVEESPTTTIAYGAGIEVGRRTRSAADGGAVQRIEIAPRASFEAGRTNLFGKNRSVNLFSGVSLRPRDAPNDPARDGQCCAFSEYRVYGTFTEPRILDGRVDGQASISVEQAIRNSFTFLREALGVQALRRLPGRTTAVGRYSLERVRLSNVRVAEKDQLLVDRLFPRVRLSMFSLSLLRDTRDDALSPGAGAVLGVDGDLAARAVGSQFGFAKTLLQAYGYRRVSPRLVMAGGARLGMLRGFVRTAVVTDDQGNPIYVDGQPLTARVEDVHVSQRFFAGGSTSVRGWELDRLGARDVLDANGLSNGGNGLVVLNGEARVGVTREIGLAAFVDSGNVFSRVSAIDLGQLRWSAGAGIRYRSPIGPLRFDVAWKLGALRATDGRRWAFFITIGEAF